jgi:hypothetical protein
VSVEGFVGSLGNGLETEIVIFETDVFGPVEPDLHPDGIFGANPDGLTLGDLKELVLIAKGEVIGHDPFGANGEDFLETV